MPSVTTSRFDWCLFMMTTGWWLVSSRSSPSRSIFHPRNVRTTKEKAWAKWADVFRSRVTAR